MARVSAIIPAYNAAATLAQAIDSALAQSFRDLEVIVVDDGSTDASAQILQSYGTRVSAITQPNAGPAAARNAGERIATGEYLAFLDADDQWLPEFIDRAVAVLDTNPHSPMVYCNLDIIDSNGRSLGRPLIGPGFDRPPAMKEILSRMWPIMPSGALIRRSAFRSSDGFCQRFKRAAFEDAFLWLLLREQGPFEYIPEILGRWRFSRFPRALKSRDDAESARIFAALVQERYGVSAEPLVRARHRAARSILGYIGLTTLLAGDSSTARQAFAAALRVDPFRMRNYLRYARTFLPAPLARALSGRTAHPVSRLGPSRPPATHGDV